MGADAFDDNDKPMPADGVHDPNKLVREPELLLKARADKPDGSAGAACIREVSVASASTMCESRVVGLAFKTGALKTLDERPWLELDCGR